MREERSFSVSHMLKCQMFSRHRKAEELRFESAVDLRLTRPVCTVNAGMMFQETTKTVIENNIYSGKRPGNSIIGPEISLRPELNLNHF